MNIAILTAAGSGTRMHQEIPKQFINVNDKPIIVYTLEAFQKHPEIDEILVVCKDGWDQILKSYARQFNISKLKYVVPGGKNGQDSIRNGLFELRKHHTGSEDLVLVHDGNRSLVSQEIISDCIIKTKEYGSGIAAIPTTEAILETQDQETSNIIHSRENLKRTQTPHGFYLKELCEMHEEALKKGITNSVASCTLAIELGKKVHFSLGSEKNLKITTIDDLDIFKALLTVDRSEWLK